jgi:hypothetical protein
VDDFTILAFDSDRRELKQLLALNGTPPYAVRALQTEAAFEHLLDRCRKQRDTLLTLVRTRLAALRALAGDWTALRSWLDDDAQLAVLEGLHAELRPQLRVPVATTSSSRALGRALHELVESLKRFNRRWQEFLPTVDVSHVNALREGYNKYYVLEKECVLGSPRLARQGFRPLEPLTTAGLASHFPPLPVPVLR